MSYSRDEIVAMTTEYLQVRDVVKNVDMDVLLFIRLIFIHIKLSA
jgi:hypothetical protein